MQRPEQLVNQIRGALSQADGQLLPPGCDALASEYAAAVLEINVKLTQAVGILREGLRSEVLHWIELSPALLAQAAALDFQSLPQWVDLCLRNDLKAPPQINESAVIELDEAFQQEQKLQEALTRHRRLALMRAPLEARLRILRRIRQMDPDNTIWHKDLLELEQARQKQMLAEARRAERQNDAPAMQALLNEARGDWESARPESLASQLDAMLNQRRAREAQASLAPAIQSLKNACASEDPAAIEQALEHYQHVASAAATDQPAPPAPPEVDQAREQLAAFRKQQARTRSHDQAITELTVALNANDTDTNELKAMSQRIAAQGIQVPDDLQQQLQEQLTQADSARQKKRKTTWLAAVTGIGLVAGVAAAIAWNQHQHQQSEAALDQLNAMIQTQAYADAALAYADWTQQLPSIQTDPRFDPIRQALKAWQAEAQTSAQRFNQTYEVLAQRLPASIGETDLAALERDATNDTQRAQVDALTEQVKQARARSTQARNDEIQAAIQTLRRQHQQLITSSPPMAWQPHLLTAQQTVAAYASIENLSSVNRASLESLNQVINQSLSQSRDAAEAAANVQQSLDRLGKLARQPLDYYGQIGADLQNASLRQTPYSKGLAEVARTAPAAADITAWSKTIAAIGDVYPTTNREAAAKLARINEYLRVHPSGQFADAALVYSSYLRRAQIALDPDNHPTAPRGDLALLLRSPLIASLHEIRLNNGETWYSTAQTPGQPTFPGKRVYGVFTELEEARQDRLSDRTLSDSEVIEPYELRPAPVSVFARHAWIRLRQDQTQNQSWHTTHLQLLRLLSETQGIDPIQQVGIAKDLISLASERDWPPLPALQQWLNQLNTVNTDVNWVNPEDSAANQEKLQAVSVLNNAPDWSALLQTAQEQVASLATDLRPIQPIATLVNRAGLQAASVIGSETLSSQPSPVDLILSLPNTDAELLAIAGAQTADDTSWSLMPVALIQQKQIRWLQAAEQLPSGTLLHWRPAVQDPATPQ